MRLRRDEACGQTCDQKGGTPPNLIRPEERLAQEFRRKEDCERLSSSNFFKRLFQAYRIARDDPPMNLQIGFGG